MTDLQRNQLYKIVGLERSLEGVNFTINKVIPGQGMVTLKCSDHIVVVYDSAAGLTVNQNNETKYISFGKINQTDFNPLPTSEVANLFNTSIAPIIISETQIPWVQVTVSGPSQPSVKHIYQFLPGKGNYGSGGTTATASMFRYVNTLGATQQDIENTGNTETINLGEVTNYITALNSVGRDFSDENLQYFVKYTISGTSYFKIFIGITYGMYGGTNTLQFTDEMWQDVVTSATPTPAVTLQDVLSNGSTAIINRETLIEYQSGTNMANVYVGDGTIDLNANDGQFHMNGTGADINVPLSLLAEPTEPDHAARLQDIEALSENVIPLSGTVAGSPVSGDIQMTETSRGFWINTAVEGDYSGVMFGEGGVSVYSITGSDNVSFTVSSEDAFISSTLSNFKGATYVDDYSANFVDRSLVDKKFVTDYVAAHAGGGGISVVNGTTDEITASTVSGTVTLGISSTYTAARNAYADNAAASAASGKENSANKQNSLTTDGTGVKFPTVDAVKAALLYYPRIIFASTTSYPGTGATSAILLKAVPISANDLSNGTIQADLRARFTGGAGNKQILLYMNTSASLTGATLLASGLNYNPSITSGNLHRSFSLNGTTLRGYAPIVQNIYPTTPTQPDLNVTYNPANQYYIIAACINASSADTTTLDMFNITFTKATE